MFSQKREKVKIMNISLRPQRNLKVSRGGFFGMLPRATVGAKSGPGGAKSGPGGSKSTPGETNPGGRPTGGAGPRLVQEAGFPAHCQVPPRTL